MHQNTPASTIPTTFSPDPLYGSGLTTSYLLPPALVLLCTLLKKYSREPNCNSSFEQLWQSTLVPTQYCIPRLRMHTEA